MVKLRSLLIDIALLPLIIVMYLGVAVILLSRGGTLKFLMRGTVWTLRIG